MKETKQAVASSEARAMTHELMAAFEAFKAENDQRLAAVEAKRADPLLEEKVARIDAAMAAAEARLQRLVSETRRPSVEGGAALAPQAGEAKGWREYLTTGAVGLELKAGLSSGSSSGGYVVPTETERLIEQRLQQTSPMREIASVRTIGSGVFKKPVSTGGVEASWVGETAARPETDPATLTALEFPAFDLYASPAATQALLDDAFVNLDEWLAAEVEDAFAAQETDAFVNGNGTSRPSGFLTSTAPDGTAAWGELGHLVTGVAGGFAAEAPTDKLIELIYAPKAQYRAEGRFVMNRRTVSAIRRFKDADGNYVWQPAARPGQTSSLFGYPVTEIEAMPDVGAGTFAVAFGDFRRGYLIVDRAGVRVLRDPYSAKPYVLFYTTKRVGGGVQNFDAIKLLKFAAS